MLRVVLLNTLMFALPFVVYALYLKTRRAGNETWRDAPFLALFGTGVLLVVVTMAIVISFGGFGTQTQYSPAVIKDGVIQPGHFDPQNDAD